MFTSKSITLERVVNTTPKPVQPTQLKGLVRSTRPMRRGSSAEPLKDVTSEEAHTKKHLHHAVHPATISQNSKRRVEPLGSLLV
jgi:hypothetical protein